MSNRKYEYKCPTEKGYTKINIAKKQHNEYFLRRQIKWHDKYEYYINDHCILLCRFNNWKLIVVMTLFLPFLILIEGLGNIKETWEDYTGLFKQREKGKFSSDHYRGVLFDEIKELHNK